MAAAMVSDPAYFEDWDGQAEWTVEGVGTFDHNPRDDVDPALFGFIRVHAQCDRGMAGFVWPDGGALLDQPVVLIEAWSVVTAAKARAREAERGRP